MDNRKDSVGTDLDVDVRNKKSAGEKYRSLLRAFTPKYDGQPYIQRHADKNASERAWSETMTMLSSSSQTFLS